MFCITMARANGV
jgi:7-dehydrocholesterol reductase